ncbi:MAG: ATP-binding protein [Candidatus Aminicenantes bacterium]|nr:ATP-binding protein [Candidatus Aminicenantes bacterium]
MAAGWLSKHLRLLFFLAVLVPGVLLSIIAVRSINREEAFLEKRFQANLDAELVHVVSLMRDEIGRAQAELETTVPAVNAGDLRSVLDGWKARSALVRVPFLVAADYRILWPTLQEARSDDERAFLNSNREFVTDRTSIPYFQNIALAYKDQITEESALTAAKEKKADEGAKPASAPAEGGRRLQVAPASVAQPSPAPPSGVRSTVVGASAQRDKLTEVQTEQRALAEFEKSPNLRQRVYDEAAAKGQQTQTRNVTPGLSLSPQKNEAPSRPPASIFISELRKFSEITAGRNAGLIPRFMAEKLSLLFWRREPGGGFVGCVVADDEFRARLVGRLPAVLSPARVLTVLDESGQPLLTPAEGASRDWRRPLVAREVSELLPRWETVAYPADPSALASQARATRLVLGVLIGLLLVSLLSGGTMVMSTLRSEMNLARQKTTFVTNVSHELKTPLTSIRMFAEMLKEGRQPDADKQRNYLGLMVSETERLTRLINNVLDFSKMERGQKSYTKKRLEAARLVEDVVESQRPRLEHDGFSVSFDDSSGGALVEADEEALKQALLNLLSNAEKYSGPAKLVDVEAAPGDGAVLVRVMDRGIGVPPAEAKKIFKEFYRVDHSLSSEAHGSGLGLAIAQRIVRDHGGDIRCLPREGGGSVFEVSLPTVEPS